MAKLFPRSVSFFLELVLNVLDPFIVLYCVSDQPKFLVVVFASARVGSYFMHVVRSYLGMITEYYSDYNAQDPEFA